MILERLSKREKLLLLATGIVISAAFVYVFVIEQLADKWRYLNSQIAEKTLKLNKNIKILRKEEWIREEFKKYAEYTVSIGRDEEIIAALLKTIEQKAGSTSTRITNIRPRPVRDAGFYKEFVFEVISESSLEELTRFIYELQNTKELLKVRKLTLTLKSSQPQTLKGVMEITKISVKSP